MTDVDHYIAAATRDNMRDAHAGVIEQHRETAFAGHQRIRCFEHIPQHLRRHPECDDAFSLSRRRLLSAPDKQR